MNQTQDFWSQLSGTQAMNTANQAFTGAQGYANNMVGQAASALPGANFSATNKMSNMGSYAGIDYPAMGESGASPSPNQNAAYANPDQKALPDSSSRGFNPWSLQGEAFSR